MDSNNHEEYGYVYNLDLLAMLYTLSVSYPMRSGCKAKNVGLKPTYHTTQCNCNEHVCKLRDKGGDLLIKGLGLFKVVYGKACTWKKNTKVKCTTIKLDYVLKCIN